MDIQINKQGEKKTGQNILADQTGQQKFIQAVREVERHPDKQTDNIDKQADRETDRLTGIQVFRCRKRQTVQLM